MLHHSKDVNFLINNIVSEYHTYDKENKCYSIDINKVPDFCIDEISSLLIQEDNLYAMESTGADNSIYFSQMLPSLIKFLSNTTDKDNEIEFVNSWKKGIRTYLEPTIEQLLSESLNELTEDEDLWAA